MSSKARPTLLLFLLLILAALGACRRAGLDPERIHAITHDFEAAAREAAGDPVRITLQEETAQGGRVLIAERLQVGVRNRKQLPVVQEALIRVAERAGLKVEVKSTSRGTTPVVELACRVDGRLTHAITLFAEPVRAAKRGVPRRAGELKVAILIDDLGYDNSIAPQLFSLRTPLNVSVLPALPYSTELAEQAHRHGFEVLLHLPMEPLDEVGNHLEPHTLKVGMGAKEVEAIVNRELDAVPHLAGVNNHQGSRATTDRALMQAVMRSLRARRIYFVDSRTTASSVAYEVAREAGVRATYRTVFLDGPQGEPSREYTLGQLRLLAEKVKQEGWGLAIGHPHRTTLEAVREYLPQLEREGIRLVYVSQLAL